MIAVKGTGDGLHRTRAPGHRLESCEAVGIGGSVRRRPAVVRNQGEVSHEAREVGRATDSRSMGFTFPLEAVGAREGWQMRTVWMERVCRR